MKQLFACVALLGFLSSAPAASLRNSSRKTEQNGWIYVHLEGSPAEIGFQNGFHLAQEIKELQKILELELT
ncbi:MAG: peptidase C45, partial [Bryobacteraceae bacterium]